MDSLWEYQEFRLGARLLGVSWTDRPEEFRHFVGVHAESPAAPSPGLCSLELPELICLACRHSDGDATRTYARLMAERDKRGLAEGRHASMIDERLPDGSMRLWFPVEGA